MALVTVLPTRLGDVTMHWQTLLMSADATPSMGLEEMYEAPDHHWQKVRGEPKSFLMAVMAGSVELHDDLEAGAASASCPRATAQTSQVIKAESRDMLVDICKGGGENEGTKSGWSNDRPDTRASRR